MDTNTPAWGSYLYQNCLLPAFPPGAAASWLASPFTSVTGSASNNIQKAETAVKGDKNSISGDGSRLFANKGQDSGIDLNDNKVNDKRKMSGNESEPIMNDYVGSAWQGLGDIKTGGLGDSGMEAEEVGLYAGIGRGYGDGNQRRSSQQPGFGYGQYSIEAQSQSQPHQSQPMSQSRQSSIFNPNFSLDYQSQHGGQIYSHTQARNQHYLPQQQQSQQQQQQQQPSQAGPSSFYPQPFHPSSSINTSLLSNGFGIQQMQGQDQLARPPPHPLTVDPSSFYGLPQSHPNASSSMISTVGSSPMSARNSVSRVSALVPTLSQVQSQPGPGRKRSRDVGIKVEHYMMGAGKKSSHQSTSHDAAHISPTDLEAHLIDDLVPSTPFSLTTSPSPIISRRSTPHHSPGTSTPKKIKRERAIIAGGAGAAAGRAVKRRQDSLDSEHDHDLEDHEHDHEHDHSDMDPEVPEGVERDGMIWGMKVEDYRALSARERKRVRNRISARTFRAKRKEHLNSLESTLGAKDLQVKLSREEADRLRKEVESLKLRLSNYERV